MENVSLTGQGKENFIKKKLRRENQSAVQLHKYGLNRTMAKRKPLLEESLKKYC